MATAATAATTLVVSGHGRGDKLGAVATTGFDHAYSAKAAAVGKASLQRLQWLAWRSYKR